MVASGLAEASAIFNSKVPGKFTPHSILQSIAPSGNGMSAADKERQLPGGGHLPQPDGISQNDYMPEVRTQMYEHDNI